MSSANQFDEKTGGTRDPKQTRRDFLKRAGLVAGAVAFPAIVPSRVLGDGAPSKRITLGCIGMGSQGTHANLANFLQCDDAQVLAVCDVYKNRTEDARKMTDKKYQAAGCRAYGDFRKIIEDPAIDAVVISTPDHWHVPISLMALEAGKHVFCEKPTLCLAEGRTLVDAVKKHGAVFQVGLEDRSLIHFHKMVEWVKNGAIGKLAKIDVSLPCGVNNPVEKPAPAPEGLDYNLWLGPARFCEYTPHRLDGLHWRFISVYGKGSLSDWGSHLIDTAQLAAEAPGTCPVEVEGTGEIPVGRETDVPVTFDVTYRYANKVEMHVTSGSSPHGDGRSAAIRFEGDKGWISRKPWSGPLEASDKAILLTRYTPETTRHWPLPPSEQRNFLDCLKSRKPTTYTAEDMHLLSTTLHLGVIAIALGRKLRWDNAKEEFIEDEAANKMRLRPESRDWAKG